MTHKRLKSYSLILSILLVLVGCTSKPAAENAEAETEEDLVARALEVHDRVLTVDTHADTPLRMIEPGFDMAERHDLNETGSKVDYPRMKEGGLMRSFLPRL